jgi:GDPmannose 4,6-dehydratase
VEIDTKYFRPAEVDFLLGNSTKARTVLKWEPKYTVREMCREMVASDIQKFRKQEILKKHGFEILSQYE